ncbi:MAG: phosphoribosylformylglycinamidine synthase, partial [Bacteroidota bacterium]
MIVFFRSGTGIVYAVSAAQQPGQEDLTKLCWLFFRGEYLPEKTLKGYFLGPRKEMITPWSTNAVEITQNMGIAGISRIEELHPVQGADAPHDRMLQMVYADPGQDLFTINLQPAPVMPVTDLRAYNLQEGLALSEEEITYLEGVSKELGRPLTDSEVFGFSQVNSEHCRHKIFNGTFVIDGQTMPSTLFQLIKKTSQVNPGHLVSAYKDNVAFIDGPAVEQFAPEHQDRPDYFRVTPFESVISLKAETHNFPTTVEPFNGAATGSGGEIRDRLAGGKGSLPLAGTAVYMTSYPRTNGGRPWERANAERAWRYQTPAQILIKASDGASDFGNKFGQPLINGSLLTFEHFGDGLNLGFDKVIMLAGGIGFGKKSDSKKEKLKAGDVIVLLGGDNYRIGMGGGAVSSVGTGVYGNAIELNAIQRSNPEMQKRVMNAIRAMVEADQNPIVSIHDHGAGGHLNCFSELLEDTGGYIDIAKLPVGDPTLSDKEVISNESQERMGVAIGKEHLGLLQAVSARERAPMYEAGAATGDHRFVFCHGEGRPVDLEIRHLLGSSPKTILTDTTKSANIEQVRWSDDRFNEYLSMVLQLESVACKDWLTNKVDRSVTGKVALQQTCGVLQLPLNNCGIMAIDYTSLKGIATAIGHAPAVALVDPAAGSRLAVAESLLNLIWAPLTHGLSGVSLSANWMWPAKTDGENARLYKAVEALSDFVCALGINVPTGKDSLSMTQKYPDGQVVVSPGTVIVSAVAEVSDVSRAVSTALVPAEGSVLYRISFGGNDCPLGGSAFAQVNNLLGNTVPDVCDAGTFRKTFEAVQLVISHGLVLSGHDVSAGGTITTLLEMCFPTPGAGMSVTLTGGTGLTDAAFAEQPAVVLQVDAAKTSAVERHFADAQVSFERLGTVTAGETLSVSHGDKTVSLRIADQRSGWFSTSAAMDALQRPVSFAQARERNFSEQPLRYAFPEGFTGMYQDHGIDPRRALRSGVRAAIIREKGVNGDREMAWALHLAGFDVKDVHMTDLIAGREDLNDVNMIVFVGGFSNSDVLGSARGWAGAFRYNEKAKVALERFYSRPDTLSLGVCNGCQLMMELGLVFRGMENHPTMHHNASGRFESAFINVDIPQNDSVMLGSLSGTRLGVWLAHGEGRFVLDGIPKERIVAGFSYEAYP